MPNDNPYLQPEDYFSGYQESIEANARDSKIIEFDKLCFHVLGMSEDGNQLMELIKEKFIMPGTPAQLGPNFAHACVYFEGFRDAFRQLLNSVNSYKQKMDAQAMQVQFKGAELDGSV